MDYEITQKSKKVEESCSPYSQFAEVYAAEGETFFSEKMIEIIISILTEYFNRPMQIVDLACGVGIACKILASKGHKVIGIDSSASMISIARRSLGTCSHNSQVTFIHQDMRELQVQTLVDAILCMYDSLNFMINTESLSTVFSHVYNSLQPKGLFIFDLYTTYGLSSCWGNKIEIHTNSDKYFVTTKNSYNKKTNIGVKEFLGFNKKNKLWMRWYEKHVMKAYPLSLITKQLYQNGFKKIKLFDVSSLTLLPISNKTQRALIVAWKET